jgi:hypothetical protein
VIPLTGLTVTFVCLSIARTWLSNWEPHAS